MRSEDENRSDTPRGRRDTALLEKQEEERRPGPKVTPANASRCEAA